MEYHILVSISSILFIFLASFLHTISQSEMTRILLNGPDKKDMSAKNFFFKYCKNDHEFQTLV